MLAQVFLLNRLSARPLLPRRRHPPKQSRDARLRIPAIQRPAEGHGEAYIRKNRIRAGSTTIHDHFG